MSLQLDRYLQARASGSSVALACEQSGIGAGEAALWERDIASGEVVLPHVRAPAPARAREAANSPPKIITQNIPEGEAAVARDNETTVQIGDGPKIPVSDFVAAADHLAGPSVAADELRLFIERIERLSEERKGIADDISDVYTEAKNRGYDKPTMRRIIRLRGMDAEARQEAAALLETYANALGLQGALPL